MPNQPTNQPTQPTQPNQPNQPNPKPPTQTIITLDLEGVLIPEIWIAIAQKTNLQQLQLTTRDIPDYNQLMQHRLKTLNQHNITHTQIQQTIHTLKPLPGARRFLNQLRAKTQLIILSDTFETFAQPLLQQLNYPTILCHTLQIQNNRITNYHLRQPNQKQQAVKALQKLNYQIIAAGDSYNDLPMLTQANHAYLFRAPKKIQQQHPQFPPIQTYTHLLKQLTTHLP